MRDEMVMDLMDEATKDRVFRLKARADLEGALRKYGYDSPEEYEAVKGFQEQTAGMSDAEVDRALAQNAVGVAGSSGKQAERKCEGRRQHGTRAAIRQGG